MEPGGPVQEAGRHSLSFLLAKRGKRKEENDATNLEEKESRFARELQTPHTPGLHRNTFPCRRSTRANTHLGEQRHRKFPVTRLHVAEERGVSKLSGGDTRNVCMCVLRVETGLESLRTATRAGRRPAKTRSSRTAAGCVAT